MTGRAEREWDKLLRIQTLGREDQTSEKYMPYEPTPYSVLKRLSDSGFIRAGDHLLDYGCGKGRVAFFLAAQTGCRATGLDHSEKLIASAEENRARFEYPERVDFKCISAERYSPVNENVFFFFNPFSEAVLRVALGRILARWDVPLRLCFYYPADDYLACLSAQPRISLVGEIDCLDLFDGDNPRERVLIYQTDAV